MLSRYSYPYIIPSLAVTVVSITVWVFLISHPIMLGIALFSLLISIVLTCFFRDPERNIPSNSSSIVSPADGTIAAVDTIESRYYLRSKSIRISIFLSLLNVHINRIPSEGKIEYIKYLPGKFLPVHQKMESDQNEQMVVGIKTKHHKIMVVQIAGILTRRIICRLREGMKVSRGNRYGMIIFGSRTDLYLPMGTEICVKPGDSVRGGSSIIGVLKNG